MAYKAKQQTLKAPGVATIPETEGVFQLMDASVARIDLLEKKGLQK